MRVQGRHWRTIWPTADARAFEVIDQRLLPHAFATVRIDTVEQAASAIADMTVRGAPLIGVTAAYGLAVHTLRDASTEGLLRAAQLLKAARPTAVNLAWAVDRVMLRLSAAAENDRAELAWQVAGELADADVATNTAIGRHGLSLLKSLAHERGKRQDTGQGTEQGGQPLNILTHCNAGWVATVDGGTALSPIYQAAQAGLAVHVWVDETRPRNQGASLTAWELREEGIPCTVIADNAGGHLMQHGQVDAVIVGCDRVTARGDVCNKIGTYLKALAAWDNRVPFWVAMPMSTLDMQLSDGLREVHIEERSGREVTHLRGKDAHGADVEVQLVPDGTRAANPAFDVTPARLVTSLITERGVVPATPEGINALEPWR